MSEDLVVHFCTCGGRILACQMGGTVGQASAPFFRAANPQPEVKEHGKPCEISGWEEQGRGVMLLTIQPL